MRQIELEKIAWAIVTPISRQLLEDGYNIRLTGTMRENYDPLDRIRDLIALQIRAELLSEKIEHREIRYPATWQDGVKTAFYTWLGAGKDRGHWPIAGDYLAKRWPARYTVTTIDARALYPLISLPDHGAVLRVMAYDRIEVQNYDRYAENPDPYGGTWRRNPDGTIDHDRNDRSYL